MRLAALGARTRRPRRRCRRARAGGAPVSLHGVADDRRRRAPRLRRRRRRCPPAATASPPVATWGQRGPARHSRGRGPRRSGPTLRAVAGGFAEDTAPADALVAVPDGRGGWAVASRSPRHGARRAGAGPQLHRGLAPSPRGPPRRLGAHVAHDVRGARLPRARRVVVRARRRAGRRRSPTAEPSAASGPRRCGAAAASAGRGDGPARARRVLAGGRRALRAQASPHRGRRARGRLGGAARGPHPGLSRTSTGWVRGGGLGGPGPRGGGGRGRGTARSRPTCAARAGSRPRSSSLRSTRLGAPGDGTGPSRHGAVARPVPRPRPPSPPTGACVGLGGGGGSPRRRRAAVLCGGCRAPGARVGPQRRRGRGRGRRRARPHHQVLRDHPGPRHARGARSWCEDDPRPPVPAGDTVFAAVAAAAWLAAGLPRRGPWIREVAREYSGRALLTGGARRAVARVLGTARHRTGARRPRARARAGFEAQARKALANLSVVCCGVARWAGPTS